MPDAPPGSAFFPPAGAAPTPKAPSSQQAPADPTFELLQKFWAFMQMEQQAEPKEQRRSASHPHKADPVLVGSDMMSPGAGAAMMGLHKGESLHSLMP